MPIDKKKTRALLSEANLALAQGIEGADRFKDVEKFRRSLIKALENHSGFKAAAQTYHLHILSMGHTEKGQVPRQVVPAGRVQAPRYDTPKGRSRS